MSRINCFQCMRPLQICHCDLIPTIDNKTEIIIAQHIRERAHPFNTARIVANALTNSRLTVDYAENFRRHSALIDFETGVLFPSKEATDLLEIPKVDLPKKLLLLDGTWNQAKRMYRKWPEIHSLKHYKISPPSPGQYRIRLEPDNSSLSTIEATVMALKIIEPETPHIDQLLNVFETMVDRQLAHPLAKYEATQRPPTLNIPYKLISKSDNLVLAYGEAEPVKTGSPNKQYRQPAIWFAEKIATNEKFKCALRTNEPISNELLQYFELPREEFERGVSKNEFVSRWNSFLDPDDILVVFNASSLRLLVATGVILSNSISLQSVNYDPRRDHASIRDFLLQNECRIPDPVFNGRAGKRLANLKALVAHLQKLLQQKL